MGHVRWKSRHVIWRVTIFGDVTFTKFTDDSDEFAKRIYVNNIGVLNKYKRGISGLNFFVKVS